MSWNITHQCRFQSRTGQQYCVNISKQTDTGQNITQLQGSEHPFVTSEANGDDIFMPIRQQTGYLRVLDKSGGTLLEELMPENNTQKMVTLVNLTTGKTEWIGFLAAEVFTQPWDNELTELEFPVKSALACLADVTMQTGVTGTNRLALLVYSAITSLFGEGDVPFTDIVLMDDFSNVCDELLIRANFEKFFSKETIKNDNTEIITRVGTSYKEALSSMCEVFGLTLRQQGTSLIFGRYDNGGNFNINVNVMDWSILAIIANSTAWPDLPPAGQIVTKDLLPIADFRGSNNKLSFVPGGKAAIVSLSVDAADGDKIIEMPQAAIIEGGVRQAVMLTAGEYIEGYRWDTGDFPYTVHNQRIAFESSSDIKRKINFQYVARNNSENEYFEYRFVNVQLTSGDNINITRVHTLLETYTDPMAVVYMSLFSASGNRYNFTQRDIVTGAVPGRWSRGNGVLENCLLLAQDVNTYTDTQTSDAACYQIKSPYNEEMLEGGYINIDFDIPLTIFNIVSGVIRHWAIGTNTYYTLNNAGGAAIDIPNDLSLVSNIPYAIICRLSFESTNGNVYYWDSYNQDWIITNTPPNFNIWVEGTSILQGTEDTRPLDNVSGYLAKITNTIVGQSGKVVFLIINKVNAFEKMKIKDPGQDFSENEIEVNVFPYQKIITDLEVKIVYARPITVGDNNNVYRKTIIDSGFSENKQIDLTLGTNNSNTPSPSLLRTYDNLGFIENISYTASDGSKVAERPEMHLLNRMVEYYKTMRRTMEAKIATGIDIFRNRFSYNGRKYMAIDKKHDWEREEQEVKFIEVT